MKIMLANTLFHPHVHGGAEAVVHLLALQLTARGHGVDVLTTTGRCAGPPHLRTRAVEGVAGVVHEAPFTGLYDLLDAARRPPAPLPVRMAHHLAGAHDLRWRRWAAAALRRSRPDLLHTHNLAGMTPAIWSAAHAAGVPIVHTLHDYHLLCARTTLLRTRGSLCERPPLPCRALMRAKLGPSRWVTAVTGPSRWVLDRHLAAGAFPRARAEVIFNAPAAPASAAAGGGAPEPPPRHATAPTGLFLGAMQVHKGVRELLAALELLGHTADAPAPGAVAFAFAGAGPLAGEVAAFCATRPGLRMFGRVDGPAREAAFAAADFLVLPSRWHDVAPLTILEAFSRGTPALGARRGGIPELIDDGVDGLLVEPQPAALAAAIGRYAADPQTRRRHGEAARRKAAAFSRERQVEAYLKLYADTIAAAPRGRTA